MQGRRIRNLKLSELRMLYIAKIVEDFSFLYQLLRFELLILLEAQGTGDLL